jgi:hypothetical protein
VVIAALEGSGAALAAWEGGSAGFGRSDASSDLDVCVLCTDGAGEQVLDEIEVALRSVTEELDVWCAEHGPFGAHRFFHPRGDARSELVEVDVAVMELVGEREKWEAVLVPERHGRALPMYDPDGVLASAIERTTYDLDTHRERIRTELDRIRARRTMFGAFPQKELSRGRELDGQGFHTTMVVGPLITLLGMKHRPLRFDFAFRYLHDELPVDVVERLVPVTLPAGPGGLSASIHAGVAWIDELLAELDPDALPIEEHSAQMRAAFL